MKCVILSMTSGYNRGYLISYTLDMVLDNLVLSHVVQLDILYKMFVKWVKVYGVKLVSLGFR